MILEIDTDIRHCPRANISGKQIDPLLFFVHLSLYEDAK